jgi:hypothetical protein
MRLMRRRAASIVLCAVIAVVTVPAITAAAPPGDNCGAIVGPRWTAPGHRSGIRWDVAESGTSCPAAEFAVRRLLRERVDRHGRLRPIPPFLNCSVDVRHRNVHPYASAACVGDRVGVSWGIHY